MAYPSVRSVALAGFAAAAVAFGASAFAGPSGVAIEGASGPVTISGDRVTIEAGATPQGPVHFKGRGGSPRSNDHIALARADHKRALRMARADHKQALRMARDGLRAGRAALAEAREADIARIVARAVASADRAAAMVEANCAEAARAAEAVKALRPLIRVQIERSVYLGLGEAEKALRDAERDFFDAHNP